MHIENEMIYVHSLAIWLIHIYWFFSNSVFNSMLSNSNSKSNLHVCACAAQLKPSIIHCTQLQHQNLWPTFIDCFVHRSGDLPAILSILDSTKKEVPIFPQFRTWPIGPHDFIVFLAKHCDWMVNLPRKMMITKPLNLQKNGLAVTWRGPSLS